MKWFYITFIYVLAFTYSKVQFNTLMPKSEMETVVRSPASASAKSGQEVTTHLSLKQKKTFISDIVELKNDFHSFFRAFSALFYKELKQEKEFQKLFSPLKKYKGTIAGDYHVENFGFAIDDKGKVNYTLNDFDDVTSGELYQDLIRHFVSSKIIYKDMSWSKFFTAYQKGLNRESHSFSFYVEKGMENVSDETELVLKTYVGADEPRFIKRKNPSRNIEKDELVNLSKALIEKFPKFEIYDQYVRIKSSGGSAGLIRYQVLGRIQHQDKIRWFDIKESAESGYDKANEVSRPFEERIKALKDDIFLGTMDKSISVLLIGGRPYSMRAVDQFATSLDLNEISEDDYSDVILDQAYVIGKIHSHAISGDKTAYQQEWLKLSNVEVEKCVGNLLARLKTLYKESKH